MCQVDGLPPPCESAGIHAYRSKTFAGLVPCREPGGAPTAGDFAVLSNAARSTAVPSSARGRRSSVSEEPR
jgi:hypothetical protein